MTDQALDMQIAVEAAMIAHEKAEYVRSYSHELLHLLKQACAFEDHVWLDKANSLIQRIDDHNEQLQSEFDNRERREDA